MTPAAAVLADLYLSLAALVGLVTLHQSLTAQGGWDPLTRRFVFGIRVTMLLFVGRALIVLTGGTGFRFLVLLAASLLPLAVLILTEGLLRRHAPVWAKALVGGGTVLFVLLSFLPTAFVDPARTWALLAFQLVGFGLAGWLVLSRDHASLSASENQTVGRLGLSLIVLIPLLAADYLSVYVGLQTQLSGLGVLGLCWLAIGLGRQQSGHSGPFVAFVLVVGVAAVTGIVLGWMAGMDWLGIILCTAMVLAAILLVVVIGDARQLRVEARSHSLLRHLAGGPHTTPLDFLRALRADPLVEGAVIVESAHLADLDAATLDRLFTTAPVLRKADPPQGDQMMQDHIDHLFTRFAATHIMQITARPRLLVALAMPALATSPRAELELATVQRVAALMAQAEGGT